MTTKHGIGLLVSMATIAILGGCGGGSTFNVQNPPPPTNSKPVTIAFQPAPPNAIQISGTLQVTAVVQNDSSNAGVDWSLSCQPTGNCGSISSAHTPSGQAVTYSAPSTVSGNNQTVSVVAFAAADHNKNVVSPMAVTIYGSVLMGTYVIGTAGSDSSGFPYQRAGVIVLDGNGGVVNGEQTVNFDNPNTGLLSSVTDPITGGSYSVGTDGRGSLVLNTNNTSIGQNGIETFSLVVLSSSQVLLTKVDDPTLPGSSREISDGTLDLQSTAPAPALGYAFVANGTDASGSAMALGGVLNIDSPLAISGAGSAFDVASPKTYGPGVVTPSSAVSGSVSASDAFGAFQIALATDFANPVQFTAYPIDGNHAKLIESDGAFGATSGDFYSQGAATGSYTSRVQFKGHFVFGIFGLDLGGTSASLAAAGVFSPNGAPGNMTNGFLDESQANDLVLISDSFSAGYSVGPGTAPHTTSDPAGIGRYYVAWSTTTGFPNFTFANPSNGSGPAWVFYMTTTGGPVLMLDPDIEPTLASGLAGGGVGTGIAYPVVAGSSFSGPYGTIFTQNSEGAESDAVGEIAANSGVLSGVLDFNGVSGQHVDDTSLNGTYMPSLFAPSVIGKRFVGPLSDNFFNALGTNPLGMNTLRMAYYPIDSTRGFFVEHDLADSAGNPVSGVLTFGYYAAPIPCPGCP